MCTVLIYMHLEATEWYPGPGPVRHKIEESSDKIAGNTNISWSC